jgi:putative membrane protein
VDFAQTIPLAAVNGGWWIFMPVMMLICMGAMMWMMMRGMGRSSSRDWSAPWNRFVSRESPLETLERRFAEGEISIDEYRARREALVDVNAQPSGDHDERLVAPRSGGR